MIGVAVVSLLLLVDCASSARSIWTRKTGNIVLLEVFGEAQCVHTTLFLRQQLLPAYRLFGSRLRIRYYPFGVTKYTKCERKGRHVECYCHHGPHECEKNALQACIMSYLPDVDDHLELVNCVQGSADFNVTVKSCIGEESLKPRRVKTEWLVTCAQSDSGRNLMSHYGRLQNQKEPQVTWVPWVVIDGVREKGAERSLVSVLCNRYLKPAPSICAAYKTDTEDQL